MDGPSRHSPVAFLSAFWRLIQLSWSANSFTIRNHLTNLSIYRINAVILCDNLCHNNICVNPCNNKNNNRNAWSMDWIYIYILCLSGGVWQAGSAHTCIHTFHWLNSVQPIFGQRLIRNNCHCYYSVCCLHCNAINHKP